MGDLLILPTLDLTCQNELTQMGQSEKPKFFQGLCLKIQAQIFSGF
jgi:hypothetical protein